MTADSLDAREIIEAAGFATGHFDILDPGLCDRLGNFTQWLNRDGKLSAEQVLVARQQILKVVINRVLLAADRQRVPAIAAEKIERPIFVIGYSRTGTSLLHALLAEDPASQAPVWWHSRQPSPPPGEMPVAPGRFEAARRELDSWNEQTPGLLAMHPYWDDGINSLIEDEEIHTIDFQNLYPTLLFRIPTLTIASLGDTADPAGCYAFQKEFLQHLQWNRPGQRWVLKGCAHQFQLQALFAEFPDAICIWPHRDPVEVHSSTLAISAVLYHAITNGNMDWQQFAQGYIQSTRAAIDQLLVNPLIDDPRIVHLRFRELVKDPITAIRQVYGNFNLPYTPEFEQRMQSWLDNPANRPDRYGRYPYSLVPFGLDAQEIGNLFADYSKHFGLD